MFSTLNLTTLGADWPQFLGPNRDGSTAASEMPVKGDSEAVTLWKRDLGSGFAGPVVVGTDVIVFHRQGNEMITESLNAVDGQTKWKHSYTTDYRDSFGFDNGPRAVPTVVDGLIFTHGPEGRVEALQLADGSPVWSFDTIKEVGSPQGFFGRACSPLVIHGKVILNVGGPNAGIIALDAKQGTLLWKSTSHEAGYASGVVMPGDSSTTAFFTRNGITVLKAATGQVLADELFRADMEASVNAASPLACGEGRLFFSACYDVGAGIWQWDITKQSLTHIWRKSEVLDCHYSTPVWHNGHLYGFHGRQESGAVLRCVSGIDGRVKWESSFSVPGGTLIRLHDHLLIVTERGELWIVKAHPSKFDLLTTTQIMGLRHRSHAAFANGVLYARDSEKLVAVKIN
ncbi:MAG: PQQ-binding-like beta-propeller repeat protein [Prosthecobacter sp.]